MEAKQCPWCKRWALKDTNCAYIFACGLDDKGHFHIGEGCGRSWCWTCEKKYCGQYIDVCTGKKMNNAKDNHDVCCLKDPLFQKEDYCPGGHSTHCKKRW